MPAHRRGHPRLENREKTWMAGTKSAFTRVFDALWPSHDVEGASFNQQSQDSRGNCGRGVLERALLPMRLKLRSTSYQSRAAQRYIETYNRSKEAFV
jgi:hypothetical protein